MAVLRSDRDVRQAVRNTLAQLAGINLGRISVAVVGGIVQFSGTVDDQAAQNAIISRAGAVKGVVGVVDNLQIQPDQNNATDSEITQSVRADLVQHAMVNPNLVTVDVVSGVVYLGGAVRTQDQKELAEEIAWWTAGVRNVISNLRVETPGQAANSA